MCDPIAQLYNAEPSYIFVQSTTLLQKVYNEVVEQGRPCQAHGAPFPCHRDSDSAKFPSILLYSLYVVWPFEIDMYGKRKKWGFLLMSVPINPPKKVYVIVFGPSLQEGTVLNQKIRVNQKM